MSQRTRILVGLSSELMLAMLPLLVVAMVVFNESHFSHLFTYPEWAFGAAILFGQALVRFVSQLSRRGSADAHFVGLIATVLVVIGLVPSLLVLNMTLTATERGASIAHWLQASQVLLFGLAVATYLFLGVVAEEFGS